VLLLANAIGPFVANLVLDGMSVTASAFIIDVVIFTVVVGLMTPLMANQFRRRQSAALGGVAHLVALPTVLDLVPLRALPDEAVDAAGTRVDLAPSDLPPRRAHPPARRVTHRERAEHHLARRVEGPRDLERKIARRRERRLPHGVHA
jgi:hypothetical protein